MASIDAVAARQRRSGPGERPLHYALGKAQRVLANVDADLGPIYCHGAVEAINELHRAAGVRLPETRLDGWRKIDYKPAH